MNTINHLENRKTFLIPAFFCFSLFISRSNAIKTNSPACHDNVEWINTAKRTSIRFAKYKFHIFAVVKLEHWQNVEWWLHNLHVQICFHSWLTFSSVDQTIFAFDSDLISELFCPFVGVLKLTRSKCTARFLYAQVNARKEKLQKAFGKLKSFSSVVTFNENLIL